MSGIKVLDHDLGCESSITMSDMDMLDTLSDGVDGGDERFIMLTKVIASNKPCEVQVRPNDGVYIHISR